MASSYGMTVNIKTDEKGADISAHGANLSVRQYCPGEPSEFFTLGAKNDSGTVSFSVFLRRNELLALHAEMTAMVNKITGVSPPVPAPALAPAPAPTIKTALL